MASDSPKPPAKKKTAAKKTPAKKTAAKKTAAKKTPAKKTAAKKAPAKKTAAKKAPTKTTTAKKTAGKTASAKTTSADKSTANKAPAKKPTRTRRTKKAAAPPPRSPMRWVAAEVGTVVLGVTLGLVAGSFVEYRRASADVRAWLDNPVKSTPGVVLSAPLTVVVGQKLSAADLISDLLRAGYERVDGAPEAKQFDDDGPTFVVHTEAGERGDITFADSAVSGVEPSPLQIGPIPLAVIGDMETHRTSIALSDLSPWVAPAVLSMEDARFWNHPGIDPLGVSRAIVTDVTGSGPMQGGSTLTQQLAKNLFLTQERTVRRKISEAFYALALERTLGKEALLELYLGEVYLGQVGGIPVHGVEQGARAFFGVSAHSLSAGQAATLAGIISSPNTWSPHRHPERATERRDLVVSRMQALGHLEHTAAEAIRTAPLEVSGTMVAADRSAPWAVDAAVDQLEEALDGGIAAGYQVSTTIDPVLQRAAERAVAEGLDEVRTSYPDAAQAQAALVAVRVSDGAIVAMVGSRDYAESPFNRATQAWRQLGSTVKPLALAAAFDADPSLTPLSVLLDEPITRRVDGSSWSPSNYDHTFVGEITVRRALEGSRNIPAVKVAEMVGPSGLQRHLRGLGLSEATLLPSAALGAFPATAVEVAGAYTVFPGGGSAVTPLLVTAVHDRDGVSVLSYETTRTPTVSAASAAMTTSILEGVITDGTGARVRRYDVGRPVAGKTGTTDGYRDAWFVGFTPDLVVAVWVGTDRGDGIGLSGSRAAIPLWGRFVADSGYTGGRFPTTDSLVAVEVCADSERIARDACPNTYWERVPAGYEPEDKCDEHGGPLVEAGSFIKRLFRGFRKKEDGEEPSGN